MILYLGALLEQLLQGTGFITLHLLVLVGGLLLHDVTDALLGETLQETYHGEPQRLLMLEV